MLQRLPLVLFALAIALTSFTTLPAEEVAPKATQQSEPPAAPSAPAMNRTATLIASLTVFVLAVFVGFEIITKVPPTLHTPLMSGSNAISGITLVGALLVTGGAAVGASRIWGLLAVVLATINVVGGFLVTHRMLAMFSKPRR